MKGEITSIREELNVLGPTVVVAKDDAEEEDCSVEDVIALSSVCLEDGYIEEQREGGVVTDDNNNDDDDDASLDTTLSLKDLLPTTTTKEEQHAQSTTQHTTRIPSGIPVYHVNTNKFPQVGAKNHIAGLPTLVLFYKGEELWRNEGLMRGEEILNVLIEFQEGGWKKKEKKKSVGGDGMKEIQHGEEVDKMMMMMKKKRKGRRLGG